MFRDVYREPLYRISKDLNSKHHWTIPTGIVILVHANFDTNMPKKLSRIHKMFLKWLNNFSNHFLVSNLVHRERIPINIHIVYKNININIFVLCIYTEVKILFRFISFFMLIQCPFDAYVFATFYSFSS